MSAFNRRFQLTYKFGLPVNAIFVLAPLVVLAPVTVFNLGTTKALICMMIMLACVVVSGYITIQGEELRFRGVIKEAKAARHQYTAEAWDDD